LNCWQQQCHQDADNGNDDQKLDEGKASRRSPLHERFLVKEKNTDDS
jgi:hypothetical protein